MSLPTDLLARVDREAQRRGLVQSVLLQLPARASFESFDIIRKRREAPDVRDRRR